jgi:N-acetylmuramoyl-L-alanine amidase
MLSIAYYFLQVSLCSAVMMLYYALVLRNKRFHQYNRFYLLGVAVLPWLMPLVKIEINKPQEAVSIPIQLFSVIADTNSEFEKTVADKGFQFTWETLVATLYIAVSSVLLTMLLIAMVKIYKLLKTNSCKNLDDVYLVLTQANGTPFSFFKFIFWHTDIDVTTTAGKQMLQHELTHVREKHSLDKLLLQIVLIIGWANPIFWLLKRELETIHEFIADNKAIDNGDTAALATMLLAAAYPQQRFALTNPFFYSPIKRRIAMLTNNKHPRFSYARRLVVLPLLVTVTLLFAFRKKETKPITLSVASALENVVGTIADATNTADGLPVNVINAKLTKTYTVVIDAGHGGTDVGAPGIDGKSHEKDIALSIAKLVKAQNANANINIVLTRDNDVFLTPPQRVDYVNKLGADLFVSLHCNSADPIKTNNGYKNNPARGYEVVIPSRERPGMEDCKLLASSINSVFNSSSFAVGQVVQKKVGIWILQATNCPATLVECGYMSNQDDLKALKNVSNQQEIATNILKGIETYLVSKEKGVSALVVDTVPNRKTENKEVTVILGKFIPNKGFDSSKYLLPGDTLKMQRIGINDVAANAFIIYGKKRISKSELEKEYYLPFIKIDLSLVKTSSDIKRYGIDAKDGVVIARTITTFLVVVDGKEAKNNLDDINPNSIKSITVLKDKNAIDKYGEKGKDGVIEVELKKESEALNGDKVFSEVETPAEFPGGVIAWKKYLELNLKIPEEAKTKNAPAGKYSVEVSFLVQKDGSLSHIDALNNPGYGTADVAIGLIGNGPKWIPAVQNGRKVNSIKKLTITFIIDENSAFTSKNPLEQPVATQRVLPAELKKFQQVSADIFEVFWIGSVKHLVIKIQHKNGSIESYNLFDAKSKSLALAKYDESILLNCKFVLKAINEQKKLLKA